MSLLCADNANVWIRQKKNQKLHLSICCCRQAANGTEDPYTVGWLVLVLRLIASSKDIKPAKTNLEQSGFEPVPSKSNSHPDTWFTGVRHHSQPRFL